MTVEITDANIKDVIASGKPVVVDFWAGWCGPCKMLAPVLEDVATKMPNVTFVKVDVDQEPGLAGRYGIQAIPNLVIFKDGQAVDQITGFVGKDVIVDKLNKLL